MNEPIDTRVCSVPKCGGAFHAKGMCRHHYQKSWDAANPKREREKRSAKFPRIDNGAELRKAHDAYHAAANWRTKLKWRRTIDALELQS